MVNKILSPNFWGRKGGKRENFSHVCEKEGQEMREQEWLRLGKQPREQTRTDLEAACEEEGRGQRKMSLMADHSSPFFLSLVHGCLLRPVSPEGHQIGCPAVHRLS